MTSSAGTAALEGEHAHDRSEDFILGDRHVVADIVENRRLDEEAAVAHSAAADHQLRTLLLAQIHVAQDLVHLLAGNLWALLGLGIQRIAHAALAGLGRQTLDEFLVNLLFDEQPAAGRAALAAVEVNGVERAGDGLLHVGVGEDHVRTLAAQFEKPVRLSVSDVAFDE